MINPIAMASPVYSMTQNASYQERIKLSWKITLYGTCLLLGTLLIGPLVLKFFGLQPADMKVAGGLVVFSIAWKMLNSTKDVSKSVSEEINQQDVMSLAFFPLTMPITAGAGSIAIVIALASQASETAHESYEYFAIASAIVAIFVLVYFCYRYSGMIFKVIGKTGEKVISSLSAFILLAIGVQVTWDGIQVLIK